MISLVEYAGPWIKHADFTEEVRKNVIVLLAACDRLEAMAVRDGVVFPINPATNSNVSGKLYGGFRPQTTTVGASKSKHKLGLAVDRFDPQNLIDEWCMGNIDKLEKCGIWIEHPSATERWSHWQAIGPKSGNRVFYP